MSNEIKISSMMPRQTAPEQFIFNAQGGTDPVTGIPADVQDYQHVCLTLSTSGHAAFTIKFQGSCSDTCPSFDAAQSNTNRWDYIEVRDLEDNNAIDGDTGVTYADDDVTQYEFNVNGLKWACASITSLTQGVISLRLKPFSNE
jgi:hypothetical protein